MLHLVRHKHKKHFSTKHHHLIDRFADCNAIIGGIALFPQVLRALKTHSVQGVSLVGISLTCITSAVWIIYGVHRKDLAVILSATLLVIASGSILFLGWLWR